MWKIITIENDALKGAEIKQRTVSQLVTWWEQGNYPKQDLVLVGDIFVWEVGDGADTHTTCEHPPPDRFSLPRFVTEQAGENDFALLCNRRKYIKQNILLATSKWGKISGKYK